MIGRTCRLEPIDVVKHADDLYFAYNQAEDMRDWTYLRMDFFENIEEFHSYIDGRVNNKSTFTFAVIDLLSEKAVGMISLDCINSSHGELEIGRVVFSPLLKKSILSTETRFLLIDYVFDTLGYRRIQWKCDTFNKSSCNAAERVGFKFEATFRQHVVYKGRSRDSHMFSIIDKEWPELKKAFKAWLSPENFDKNGRQIKSLVAFRKS